MTDILDIHSHILPEMDDGAASVKEAIYMLKEAAEQGIAAMIATPHFSGRYQNKCPERIRELCREIEEQTEKELGYRMQILPGQEIFYTGDMFSLLDRGELLTMADSRYVLVECLPGTSYADIFRMVRKIVMEQYYPILAHIERYKELRDINKIEELEEQGAYIQMNYHSVGGRWYSEQTRWCRKLLKEEKVHFMGTDMHNMKNRKPDIRAALSWMQSPLANTYIRKILKKNAEKILQNEKI